MGQVTREKKLESEILIIFFADFRELCVIHGKPFFLFCDFHNNLFFCVLRQSDVYLKKAIDRMQSIL